MAQKPPERSEEDTLEWCLLELERLHKQNRELQDRLQMLRLGRRVLLTLLVREAGGRHGRLRVDPAHRNSEPGRATRTKVVRLTDLVDSPPSE
jgi:hypothetical protein